VEGRTNQGPEIHLRQFFYFSRLTDAATFAEFSVPTRNSPFDITAGPSDILWFTENESGKIGGSRSQGKGEGWLSSPCQ
jgi:streptogramin lyase